MAAFSVSVVGGTITISEGDPINIPLKNVNMPLIDNVVGTTQWKENIFFKVYDRTGASPYIYDEVQFDLIGINFTAHDFGMMLAMLLPNLYNNVHANTLQTQYPEFGPLFSRLNGTDILTAPSYEFSANFDDSAYDNGTTISLNNASGCVFTHFGIGTQVLNTQCSSLCNGSALIAVHVTGIDPANPFTIEDTFYGATPSNVATTYVVYTNLFTTAFSNYIDPKNPMIHPFQFLAIWPIFARFLKHFYPTLNPTCFTNWLFDTFWLQRGQSTYFDRTLRLDTTYGAFGNYLLSVFNYNPLGGVNAWNIPVLPVFGSTPEYAVTKILIDNYANTSPATPSANDPDLSVLWNGGFDGLSPTTSLSGNIVSGEKKVFRRLIIAYCAALSHSTIFGNAFITNTENAILAKYPSLTLPQFYQSGASQLANGEYAHMWKYASQIAYGGSNVFSVFVNPYISWGASVTALPNVLSLEKNFRHGQNQIFLNTVLNTQLTTTINTTLGLGEMNGSEKRNVEDYVYTPI